MTERKKSGQSPAFGFIRIDRKLFKVPASGVGDMIGATGDGSAVPSIVNVEYERGVDSNVRMQTFSRLPGPVSDSTDRLALPSRRDHRNPLSIARDEISVVRQA